MAHPDSRLYLRSISDADFVSATYLKEFIEHYRQEVEEVRGQEANYRRPVFGGDPLDQNAAVWYRQALPRFTAATFEIALAAVNGGVAQYAKSVTPEIVSRCREARSTRVQNALRSTHCNWELSMTSSTRTKR